MRTLHVDLPSGSYPIHIGSGALDAALAELVRTQGTDLVVTVTNDTLEGLYPGRIETALAGLEGVRLERVVLPDGERFKTLETMGAIFDRLMSLEANRKTVIVAFGGGVIGDMAGFAAATFMRGVPVIQVPTTLLAHVDSSVGGKTGVNHPQGKNAIGAFNQPQGVVIDLEFLATLPGRERNAGLFELIKHGIIYEPELFGFLEEGRSAFDGLDAGFWEEAIFRSCRVKAAVVQQDEREAGLRAILNFGHTLGHLIETHTGYKTYLHGEAVGVGMLFAAYASREWGHISEAEHGRIRALLEPLIAPVNLPPLDEAGFTRLIMHDKKASQRTVRFIRLEALGKAALRDGTTPAELWPLFQSFAQAHPGVLRLQRS